MSVNEKMTAIADNIREKTGGAEALTLEQMASGVNDVYEAGKKSEYDAFWDSFQYYGQRKHYAYGFYFSETLVDNKVPVWTDENFKPKYDIIANGSAEKMFYNCDFTDFKGILEKQGVVLDTSIAYSVKSAFGRCSELTRLPVLNLSYASNIDSTFEFCRKLKSIDKIILNNKGTQTFTFPFNSCTSLNEIRIEGVIGTNFKFNYSSLVSVESMKSIISCLNNYAGTANEYKYTITFKVAPFETLEASDEIPPSGATWTEYIDDLKWNLTLS